MKYFIILLLIVGFHWDVLAQVSNPGRDYSFQPNLPSIPPPPDAASLGKFGEIPVSLHTGLPSISVPLYTIAFEDFSLPISLDYHASGIKVDEVSSVVGLGWALNAGDVVSVKVNGISDYVGDTWKRGLPGNIDTFDPNSPVNVNDIAFAFNATDFRPSVDTSPDEFFYNFAGKSGKIVFDENEVPRTIPFDPMWMKVE